MAAPESPFPRLSCPTSPSVGPGNLRVATFSETVSEEHWPDHQVESLEQLLLGRLPQATQLIRWAIVRSEPACTAQHLLQRFHVTGAYLASNATV